MNFLTALFDGISLIIRRNPITILVIVLLAIVAPSLLKGVAIVALYIIMGLVTLIAAIALSLRWKIRKLQKQAAESASQGGFSGQGGFNSQQTKEQSTEEGEVKIYKTSTTPEKKINNKVGDYVEFEETKE